MRILLVVLWVCLTLGLWHPAQAQSAARPVAVVNFPDPQTVSGSVEVSNLPDVQEVTVTNTPLPIACQETPHFRFVGLTQARTVGFGRFTLNGLCTAEYGATARMCEIAEVQGVTPQAAGQGWLNNGETPDLNLNCNRWTGGSASGDTVAFQLPLAGRVYSGFLTAACSTELSVSCCAPGT